MASVLDSFVQGAGQGATMRQQRQQVQDQELVRGLAPQIVVGDTAAYAQAAAVDPKAAQGYQEGNDAIAKRARGAAKFLQGALQSGNPQQIAAARQTIKPFMETLKPGTPYPLDMDPQQELAGIQAFLGQTAYVDAKSTGAVQSTYVDDAGQRVAILRDGSTRVLGANNPNIRVMEQPGALPYGVVTSGGQAGNIVQLGGAQPPQGAQQPATPYTIDPSLPPQVQQQIRQAEASGQPVPSQMNIAGPVRTPTAAEIESAKLQTQLQYAPAMGQVAAQTAGASEAARQSAQLQYLPQQEAIKTNAAIQQSAGVTQARGQVEQQLEAQQALPRVVQTSNQAIGLIDQALNHPGRAAATGLSGTIDPRNYTPGTDARDFQVLLDQIKGGTFLQAFQTLKGGGAITEVEGRKAEQAIARLNTAQSDEAFAKSLQDLKEVANSAKQTAIRRASGNQLQTGQRITDGPSGGRTVVRTGTHNGRRVVQYSDGTTDYAD